MDGKVAIVGGGTYGIGRGITVRLAQAGYQVVAFGLDAVQMGSSAAKGSEGTAAELATHGLTADILEADVSKAADVQRVVDHALNKYGRVHALVNNAAIRPGGTILDISEEVFDRVVAVNLKGMFLTCKAVIPHMIEHGGGAIVNTGSGSGWGRPNILAYCSSKSGVFGFSAALAYDHRKHHIRVNVVVPGGGVVTGMTEGDAARLVKAAQASVAGRSVLPIDVANAVNFLLSDEAEQVTGAVLNVGGFLNQGGSGGG